MNQDLRELIDSHADKGKDRAPQTSHCTALAGMILMLSTATRTVGLLGSPPALGAISLSVLRAANALVVPVPPTVMDFSSTAAFLSMLDETIEQLADRGLAPELTFLRFVASKVDENKSMQKELLQLMRTLFGHAMVRTPLKDSAEIDNATARLMTVYELDGPATSSAVRNRCLNYLDGVNSEIEVDIRSMWPSHQKRLRQEALV